MPPVTMMPLKILRNPYINAKFLDWKIVDSAGSLEMGFEYGWVVARMFEEPSRAKWVHHIMGGKKDSDERADSDCGITPIHQEARVSLPRRIWLSSMSCRVSSGKLKILLLYLQTSKYLQWGR